MFFLSNNNLDVCRKNNFYFFSNAEGKTWLMPVKNIRTAMNLYQPSSRSGKLVKNLFPALHVLPPIRSMLHVEVLQCSLKEDFNALLCNLLRTMFLEFSIFYGTPSVHQKITIQLNEGNKIVGYCKITDSEGIAKLLEKEANTLRYLSEKGVGNIPQCIYHGEWTKRFFLLVQSTTKTNHSRIVHDWGELQEGFQNNLYQMTKQCLLFEESDFYQTLMALKQHLEWLPNLVAKEQVGKTICKILSLHRGKKVEYSAYHADFTPWNMFVESGKLYVFDWEYARMTYPPKLDRYHHFLQTAIFERHWNADKIIEYRNSGKGKWISTEEFQCYLLDIISRFTIREKGVFLGDVARTMTVWLSILRYLNK